MLALGLAGLRRRSLWEAARGRAAALQQAVPLSSSSSAAAAAAEAAPPTGSAGELNAGEKQADDVRQLRYVLKQYARKPARGTLRYPRPADLMPRGGSSGRGGGTPATAGSPPRPPPRSCWSASQLGWSGQEQSDVLPLSLSEDARRARQEQSVWLNKMMCRKFDDLHRKLSTGRLPPEDRLAAAQSCLDAVSRVLHLVMDDVNMSTFFHRISRLVAHPEIQSQRGYLDSSKVLPVLVARFEGLLDRIIRQESKLALAGSGEGGGSQGDRARLPLSSRSLASSFWALGNMRYPLTSEQLDKVAGVIMLKYSELSPTHVSMLLVALNSYANRPFEGKLLKVLLERTAHMPAEDFEARTLLNVLCAAGAAGATASPAVMDRLSLAALACLPEYGHGLLGSLVWSLGKLGCRLGAARIHPPILHAITAAVWKHLHEVSPDTFCNVLYGFGLLNFHPGEDFLDAAAARMKQLLPEMTPQQIGNSVWSFARLEYSPDPNRDMWAISSSSTRRRPVGSTAAGYMRHPSSRISSSSSSTTSSSFASGGSSRQRRAAAEAHFGEPDSAAAVAAGIAEAARAREQLAAAQGRNMKGLAERIAVARAKRETFYDLLRYTRTTVAAALARAPTRGGGGGGASNGGGGGAEEGSGQAVNEAHMADLVHFIATGSRDREAQRRIVLKATPDLAGLEATVDARTGVTQVRPYYTHEQVTNVLSQGSFGQWNQQQEGQQQQQQQGGQLGKVEEFGDTARAAAGQQLLARIRQVKQQHQWRGEEEQQQAAAAAAVAAAAASGELESLDAFFSLQEAAAAVDADVAPGDASEAADSMLEDPELADGLEAAEGDGHGGGSSSGSSSGGSSGTPYAAATASIDLDAVQRQEEEEEEEERQRLQADAALGEQEAEGQLEAGGQLGAAQGDQAEQHRQWRRQWALDTGDRDEASAGIAQLNSYLDDDNQAIRRRGRQRRSSRQERREEERRQQQEQRQQQREEEQGAAARAAGRLGGRSSQTSSDRSSRSSSRSDRSSSSSSSGRDMSSWRGKGLLPDELLQQLLADGSMLSVPTWVKKRWSGEERCLLDDAAERCMPLAHRMSGGEIGTLMWAFASMRHVHPGLFASLLDRVDSLAGTLTWRGVAIVMWACAVTRQVPSRGLVDRLVDRYVPLYRKRMEYSVDLHSLCNVAWALAVFDYLTPDRFTELCDIIPNDERALSSMTTAAWCQFFQCALYLEAKTGAHYSTFLPPHLLPRAEAHWQARDTTTSRLQNKVADALHSLGVPFAEEYSPRANFFGIDIAIQGENDVRLAVEVDGPQHFSSNPPHIPLASTHMRNRLLEMHGWEVVSVPFNHWAQLDGPQEKQDYLRQHVLSRLGGQDTR